jgi:hypothetical protein
MEDDAPEPQVSPGSCRLVTAARLKSIVRRAVYSAWELAMAFDERLAERVRGSLGRRKGLAEKKMFGGVAFLLNGNMCVGVHKSELIVRLAPEDTDAALAQTHTRRFDLTGRPMKGWILVEPAGLKTDAKLGKWVQVAANYAGSLPAK